MDIVPCIVSFGTEAKEKGLGDNSSIPGSATGSLFDLGEGFLAKICGLFSTSIISTSNYILVKFIVGLLNQCPEKRELVGP